MVTILDRHVDRFALVGMGNIFIMEDFEMEKISYMTHFSTIILGFALLFLMLLIYTCHSHILRHSKTFVIDKPKPRCPLFGSA